MHFLLAILLAVATPGPGPAAAPREAARPSPDPLSPASIFSRRALRRAKLLIQMRMLQLGEERLECIRAALERRLPEALWPEVPSPSRGAADAREAAERCEESLKF